MLQFKKKPGQTFRKRVINRIMNARRTNGRPDSSDVRSGRVPGPEQFQHGALGGATGSSDVSENSGGVETVKWVVVGHVQVVEDEIEQCARRGRDNLREDERRDRGDHDVAGTDTGTCSQSWVQNDGT